MSNIKRFLSVTLCLVILISTIPISVFATSNENEFSYTESLDGTITITGYNGSDKNIVIPSTIKGKQVKKIGDGAFNEKRSFESIVIPQGVIEIGSRTFQYATGMKTVYIPLSCTSMGFCAFNYCWGLTDVYYEGTESQFNAIGKSYAGLGGFDNLLNATKHYNYSYVSDLNVGKVLGARIEAENTNVINGNAKWPAENASNGYCVDFGYNYNFELYFEFVVTAPGTFIINENAFWNDRHFDLYIDDTFYGSYLATGLSERVGSDFRVDEVVLSEGVHKISFKNDTPCAPVYDYFFIQFVDGSEGYIVGGEDYSELTANQYLSKIFTNNGYIGSLNNNGNDINYVPYSFIKNFFLDVENRSRARIIFNEYNSATDYKTTSGIYQILTFSGSSAADKVMELEDYYTAILLSILDAQMADENFLDDLNCKTNKTVLTLSSNCSKYLSTVNGLENKDLAKININDLSVEQKQNLAEIIVNNNDSKQLWKLTGENIGVIKDILSAAETVNDALKGISNIARLANVGSDIQAVLQQVYLNCPENNMPMKNAARKVCEYVSGKMSYEVLSLGEATQSAAKYVLSALVGEVWKSCLTAVFGELSAGVLIGQAVGKLIANYCFATDAVDEQLCAISALVDFESVLTQSIYELEKTYKTNDDSNNSDNYITSLRFLMSTYELGCDYVEEFIKTAYTAGVVNKVIYGDSGELREWDSVFENQKSINNQIKSFLYLNKYKQFYRIDAPAAYKAYFGNSEIPSKPPVLNAGTSGNCIWMLNDTHLTISGIGKMGEYNGSSNLAPWGKNITSVSIEQGVISIGDGAFSDCSKLISIIIPDSVTYIDGSTFENCNNFVIKTTEGSVAHKYAVDNNIKYEFIPKITLKFSSASLTVQSDLSLSYKVSKTLIDNGGYSNPYVIFELGNRKVRTDKCVLSEDGNGYVFTFDSISPDQMNDTILATLYAEFNGTEYASKTKEYSIAVYCYNLLDKYSGDENIKLRTLLIDLLNYGSASQLYTGHNENNLANAGLTDEQKSFATANEPMLTTVKNIAYKTIDDPSIFWKSAGLNLQKSVAMRFKIAADSTEELSVRVKTASGSCWTIGAKSFNKIDGGYEFFFDELGAGQMSEPVYLTVYKGNTAVSNTICYSIESYAYAKQGSTDMVLTNLLGAMMKYGNSAKAYAY